jgi:alpha-tubulin suppressor-like RCC1 family protein
MNSVAAVSAGGTRSTSEYGIHTLAVKKDGSLWAWGANQFGQLGDGTDVEHHVPIKVMDGVKIP